MIILKNDNYILPNGVTNSYAKVMADMLSAPNELGLDFDTTIAVGALIETLKGIEDGFDISISKDEATLLYDIISTKKFVQFSPELTKFLITIKSLKQ